eukprot:scaffold1312_cov393-Prasinococcus_capsulatus_cf.AAC.13
MTWPSSPPQRECSCRRSSCRRISALQVPAYHSWRHMARRDVVQRSKAPLLARLLLRPRVVCNYRILP